jgi:hypothetical protein
MTPNEFQVSLQQCLTEDAAAQKRKLTISTGEAFFFSNLLFFQLGFHILIDFLGRFS